MIVMGDATLMPNPWRTQGEPIYGAARLNMAVWLRPCWDAVMLGSPAGDPAVKGMMQRHGGRWRPNDGVRRGDGDMDGGAEVDGIGAVVRVITGKDQQWQMLRSGSSYLSQSELVLTFGLGAQTKADSVEVQWTSGQVDKLTHISAGQTVAIGEAKGVIASKPHGKP